MSTTRKPTTTTPSADPLPYLSAACGAWAGPDHLTHAACGGCTCACHAPDDDDAEPIGQTYLADADARAAHLASGLTCAWCVDDMPEPRSLSRATCHVRITRGEPTYVGRIYPACERHAATLTGGIAWAERVDA